MRLFAQLCQIGFRCPHHSLSDDCDDLCIHPYTRENCPADELFGLLDDVCECPLVKEGSELEDIISALHYNWDEFFPMHVGFLRAHGNESTSLVLDDARCRGVTESR